jgi:hypothetical protein
MLLCASGPGHFSPFLRGKLDAWRPRALRGCTSAQYPLYAVEALRIAMLILRLPSASIAGWAWVIGSTK